MRRRTQGLRAVVPLALALLLAAAAGRDAVRPWAERGPEADLAVGLPGGGGASLLRRPTALNHDALSRALGRAGIDLVEGTGIYAAKIVHDAGGLRYEEFDAGTGAFSTDFWPASSIKVVAAAGALEFLATLGFTGAATVTIGEDSAIVRDLYEEAVRDSSNPAYDWLVAIAGVDWLNTEFLVPRNGFSATVIQRSYSEPGFVRVSSPQMTISEGERSVEVPAREPQGHYSCPDEGNCTNLLELGQTVRRIVLNDEVPSWERFVISSEDIAALRQALLEAQGFIDPGAVSLLGGDVLVFNKPGEAPEDDCVDVGVVQDAAEGYVLAINTPADGLECETVTQLAEVTLSFLQDLQP